MIRVTFSGTDAKVAAFLRLRAPAIIQALTLKMNSLAIRLQAKIVGEKLSGQVLTHRTGKLAGSVRVIPATAEGGVLRAGVEAAGGPAWYGRIFEYGGQGAYEIVPVNKKALAFMIGGKQVIVKSVLHPPLKERAFMRPSLAEMNAQIQAELRQAVTEAVRAQ